MTRLAGCDVRQNCIPERLFILWSSCCSWLFSGVVVRGRQNVPKQSELAADESWFWRQFAWGTWWDQPYLWISHYLTSWPVTCWF